MSNELGEFLRELRGNRTMREVAKHSKLSHSFIRQVESGLNARKKPFKPTVESLRSLANFYQVPIEILLKKAGIFDDKQPLIDAMSGKEFEVLYMFNRLDAETQDLIIQTLRRFQKKE